MLLLGDPGTNSRGCPTGCANLHVFKLCRHLGGHTHETHSPEGAHHLNISLQQLTYLLLCVEEIVMIKHEAIPDHLIMALWQFHTESGIMHEWPEPDNSCQWGYLLGVCFYK